MGLYLAIMVFVLGSCFGSFVNMMVYRTAVNYGLKKTNKKIKGQRSVCDFCQKQLNWYENIPIISWFWLRGKTKCCQTPLPWYYPLMEIVTGSLFLFVFYLNSFSFDLKILLGWLIVTFLVFSAVFDLKYMILPDFSTLLLLVLAIFLMIFSGLWHNVLSGVGAGGFIFILYWLTRGKGMGFGDVKFAVFMGLFLGYPKIITAFYVAFIVGAVVGLILMIIGKARRKSQIPFGPFLVLGVFIGWWLDLNILLLNN